MQNEKAVIIDIDGTIAKHVNRDVYDYSRVLEDVPKKTIINWIRANVDDETVLIFLTGRDDICETDTIAWLGKHILFNFKSNDWILLMRRTGDFTKSFECKKELYMTKVEPYYNIQFAIDDMDKNTNMWKNDCGLKTYLVVDDKVTQV
jgi:hypothetical protein